MEWTMYDGDVKVTLEVTQEKKDAILERIIEYCKENECTSGESLHQNDNCLIDAPNVLSDIIDDILDFKTEYQD
tara:strand:- start:371 stop:592 length:222 start_codon:yes stop_codon:yes gene_type:complete